MHFTKTAASFLAAAILLGTAGSIPASAASQSGVQIKSLGFSKVSSKKIKLTWSDAKDPLISEYLLQRYDTSAQKWKTIAKLPSDGTKGNGKHSYTDNLSSNAPQQYRYRVNVKVNNTEKYKAVSGKAYYASNIKVCIDPGHYGSKNGGTYGYTEGQATIKIALAMKDYLKAEGIDSYMTRTGSDITVGGLKNSDNGTQLDARGHAAAKNNCDMFLSVHTNANNANANGSDTIHQPSSLNKTVVFVNRTAYKQSSKTVINIADKAGAGITTVNRKLGVPTTRWLSVSKNQNRPYVFHTKSGAETAKTDKFTAYNDSPKMVGTVIYRTLNGSNDYYAVLRAAASDGVPGMLIEHSYHTVPAYCKAFMSYPKLAKYYAIFDARAIASGYGFKMTSTL